MTQAAMLQELTMIAERLETIADEARSLTGYGHVAVALASSTVFHSIDLLHAATKIIQRDDKGSQ